MSFLCTDWTPVWIGIGLGVPLLIFIVLAVVLVVVLVVKRRTGSVYQYEQIWFKDNNTEKVFQIRSNKIWRFLNLHRLYCQHMVCLAGSEGAEISPGEHQLCTSMSVYIDISRKGPRLHNKGFQIGDAATKN